MNHSTKILAIQNQGLKVSLVAELSLALVLAYRETIKDVDISSNNGVYTTPYIMIDKFRMG